MKSIFLVFVLVGAVFADDDHAESAINFNKESFNEQVPKAPHFVMFFAPWCGHCKRLAPTWEDLSAKYNNDVEQDVKIGKVDCTVETELCSGQDVTGYPTLKFFKDGVENGVKYRGARDEAALTKFINQQMGVEVEEAKPEEPKEKKEKEAVAEPEEAKVENGLYILSDKSFKNHVAKGDHFIKFYAPWCGHCQKLAPTWDELAKAFEKDPKVKIAKLDCTQAQSVCQEAEVRGYPTLHYFRDGKKVESYKGARTMKELKDFVDSMREDKKEAKEEEKKEPTEAGASKVVKVDNDNFKETVAKGFTFVKFFAPWCGHCKRLAPTWDELSTKYADNAEITIAKVDCTADDNKNKELCNGQGVNGFPTLNLYKDGEKIEEYNGSRKIEDLSAFLDKHLGGGDAKKDEL